MRERAGEPFMRAVQIGVLQVSDSWKLFRDLGQTRTFQGRSEALAAAEALVDELRSRGSPVELYVDEETAPLN